tara:strand:+ start:1624 stop:2154 length:531 start_codon:yes stop_codon:yes gene_type:complete
MACILTKGRTEPCRDAIGGLRAIYLTDFLEDSFTIVSGEATAIDAGVTEVFKYELLADGNTLVETFTADANNGTSIYEQVLTVALKKQDKETASEIATIVKARPIAVAQYRDGSYKVVGISDGTVATGDIQSGGAKADFNGYNLTLTATEVSPAPTLDSSTVTALLALVSATNINP